MPLENKLLRFLAKPKYIPLDAKNIVKTLNIGPSQQSEFKELLSRLLDEGRVALVKNDRYVISKDADLTGGIIKFRPSGSAFLIPDTPPGAQVPDPITILPEDTDVAIHQDHVLARVFKKRPRPIYRRGRRLPTPKEPETFAKVKRILQRTHSTITGTLKKTPNFYFVIPDDPRIVRDITIPKLILDANIGDKVIVQLLEWKHSHLNPEGRLIENLGPTHSPGAEYAAILHKYKLNPDFPDAVMREVNNIPPQVCPNDIKNRLDCRHLFTVTIDPDDAKDFDDALTIESLKNGNTRVGVHIADVCAYVPSNSNLDKEARNRGNSTYLVGTVIPMLPKALSNGICSLVEGQNRLTKAVFLTFDKNKNIIDIDFANTLICSNKRLTYHQTHTFLTEDDLDKIRNMPLPPSHQTASIGKSIKGLPDNELLDLISNLHKLWSLASHLRKLRMQKGSLDLDMPEVKIFVDPDGYAERIEKIEYDESHQLIEEFMLAANEAVAKAIFDARMPSISRVHDKPGPEKLNDLRDTLLTFHIATGDLTKRKSVVQLLQKIKHHPQGHALKIHFLRSLKQACYRAKTDGHYGLYKTHYTHFTSPIRRYSDLIVHRIFDNFLTKHQYPTAHKHLHKVYKKGELESLAQHVSITEQNSTEAERESVKIKLLEFFERELHKTKKTILSAMITEVRNHGFFVELLESQAFGFIHTSALKDDLYKLNPEGTILIGRRRGKSFTAAQIIEVVIERVDRFKRQIDFKLADEEFSSPSNPQKTNDKKNTKIAPTTKKRSNRSRPTRRNSSK